MTALEIPAIETGQSATGPFLASVTNLVQRGLLSRSLLDSTASELCDELVKTIINTGDRHRVVQLMVNSDRAVLFVYKLNGRSKYGYVWRIACLQDDKIRHGFFSFVSRLRDKSSPKQCA